MSQRNKLLLQTGFGAVEGLLVIVGIAVVVGAGIFVMKRNKTPDTTVNNASTASAVAPSTVSKIDASKLGTTSGVDQSNDAETQDEAAINSKHEASDQQSAVSTNSAASDVGGSYNESNF